MSHRIRAKLARDGDDIIAGRTGRQQELQPAPQRAELSLLTGKNPPPSQHRHPRRRGTRSALSRDPGLVHVAPIAVRYRSSAGTAMSPFAPLSLCAADINQLVMVIMYEGFHKSQAINDDFSVT
jgi:hypothetical protein